MSLFALLRLGNIYRILAVNLLLVWGVLLMVRAPGWGYIAGGIAALLFSLWSAWWIGRRISPTLEQWRQLAQLAGQEDFSSSVEPQVPYALKPVHSSLAEARRQLSDSLARARQEKALLISMLDAMTGGVIAVDADGRILLVNRVALRLFGVAATESPETFEGQMLVQLARDPRLNELVDRVLSTGRPMRDETEILSTRRMVDLSVAPISGDGRVKGVVAAIADETALKKLERVRQDFVTNVSHELKTPIAVIRGWSEALSGGLVADSEEAKEAVATIYRQSERLSELVDDLLVLARVESTGAEMTVEDVFVEDLFHEVHEALEAQMRSRSIELKLEVTPSAEVVGANARSLTYVLRNLVDNAIKYSPESGRITVRAFTESPDAFVLEVEDHGQGIDAHHLHRIFERFYRVDAGRSREFGGNGLGLSIVKNLVTTMGGHVTVESRVGEGTTFRVVLPNAARAGVELVEEA